MQRTRTAALAVAIALISTQAFADCGHVVMPPAQFDHVPSRKFFDYRLPYWDVNSACRAIGQVFATSQRIEGCIVPGPWDGVPLRIIPNDRDPNFTACIIRHENGHLNGWSADHDGGRFE